MNRFLPLVLALLLGFSPFAARQAAAEPVESQAAASPVLDLSPTLPVLVISTPEEARITFLAGPGAAAGVARPLAAALLEERKTLEKLLGGLDAGPMEIRMAYGREEFSGLQPRGARGPGWAAGLAYPAHGLIVVDAQASGRGGDVRAVLRHELAHVALGRLVKGPMPRWFTEGFAILYAGEWSLSRSTTLARATVANAMIPMEDLEASWPGSPTDVDLAYAQSASLVSYLAGSGDGQVLQRLVRLLGEGVPFDDALSRAYGQPLVIVEIDWKRALKARYGWMPFFVDSQLVLGMGGVILIIGAFRARRKARRRLLIMAKAEAVEDEISMGTEARSQFALAFEAESRLALWAELEEGDPPPGPWLH